MWNELLGVANQKTRKLYTSFQNYISQETTEDLHHIINTPENILIEALENLKKVNLQYK